MRTALSLLSLIIASVSIHAKTGTSEYPLTTTVIASPTEADSLSPTLTQGSDNEIYLTWIELRSTGGVLKIAQYLPATKTWSEPNTIIASDTLLVDSSHAPSLTAGRNQSLVAAWLSQPREGVTIANLSRSYDGGSTWDSPTPLTTESNQVGFPQISFWRSGKLLAAWLDGRAEKTSLYARVIGNDEPDTLIDYSVSESSPLDFTLFPNSSALLAYRGLDARGVQDIHRVAWDGREWSELRILNHDAWRPTSDLTEGPRLDSSGGQVAATWFTAAFNSPRVLVSTSPDAGARFTMPQTIDLDHAMGRPDLKMLRDGSVIVIWQENGDLPGLYLRRIAPSQTLSPAVRLVITGTDEAIGNPRLALLKDYGSTSAQLIATYTQSQQVHTLLITLPDLSTIAGRKPCLPCDEDDANATRGYPVKGIVTRVMADRGMVIVKHEEIPGVMRAMTMAFKVEAETLSQLSVDQELLGRIERQGRDWHLFNVKLLGSPKSKVP